MTYQDDLRPWAVFRCGEINNICSSHHVHLQVAQQWMAKPSPSASSPV